jgi:hypothetical protein
LGQGGGRWFPARRDESYGAGGDPSSVHTPLSRYRKSGSSKPQPLTEIVRGRFWDKAEVVGSLPAVMNRMRPAGIPAASTRPYPDKENRDPQNRSHSQKSFVGGFGTRRRS